MLWIKQLDTNISEPVIVLFLGFLIAGHGSFVSHNRWEPYRSCLYKALLAAHLSIQNVSGLCVGQYHIYIPVLIAGETY